MITIESKAAELAIKVDELFTVQTREEFSDILNNISSEMLALEYKPERVTQQQNAIIKWKDGLMYYMDFKWIHGHNIKTKRLTKETKDMVLILILGCSLPFQRNLDNEALLKEYYKAKEKNLKPA